jgi:hypothetical protein
MGGQNRKGEICEHPYYLDRIAINLDVSKGYYIISYHHSLHIVMYY